VKYHVLDAFQRIKNRQSALGSGLMFAALGGDAASASSKYAPGLDGSGTLCGIRAGELDISPVRGISNTQYSCPFLRLIDTHIRVYFCFYRRRQ